MPPVAVESNPQMIATTDDFGTARKRSLDHSALQQIFPYKRRLLHSMLVVPRNQNNNQTLFTTAASSCQPLYQFFLESQGAASYCHSSASHAPQETNSQPKHFPDSLATKQQQQQHGAVNHLPATVDSRPFGPQPPQNFMVQQNYQCFPPTPEFRTVDQTQQNIMQHDIQLRQQQILQQLLQQNVKVQQEECLPQRQREIQLPLPNTGAFNCPCSFPSWVSNPGSGAPSDNIAELPYHMQQLKSSFSSHHNEIISQLMPDTRSFHNDEFNGLNPVPNFGGFTEGLSTRRGFVAKRLTTEEPNRRDYHPHASSSAAVGVSDGMFQASQIKHQEWDLQCEEENETNVRRDREIFNAQRERKATLKKQAATKWYRADRLNQYGRTSSMDTQNVSQKMEPNQHQPHRDAANKWVRQPDFGSMGLPNLPEVATAATDTLNSLFDPYNLGVPDTSETQFNPFHLNLHPDHLPIPSEVTISTYGLFTSEVPDLAIPNYTLSPTLRRYQLPQTTIIPVIYLTRIPTMGIDVGIVGFTGYFRNSQTFHYHLCMFIMTDTDDAFIASC
ncbi:hypothetical protein BZA77DRAFT_293515 [Pyronema omphalodes]|nr:hypothetical protein BZA77DRAFT_293515 [Pyronema omphalodes]